MLARDAASFWRENMVAVVILLQEGGSEGRSGGNKLSNVRSFRILQSGEGSTSFNNANSSNLSGPKKYNEEFRGVYFLTIREQTLIKPRALPRI